MSAKIYYFIVDTEKSGDRLLEDVLLMIGSCLGDNQGNIIETKAFCGIVPPNEKFEKKCWDEFWTKNLPVLERIRRNSTETMLADFMNYFYGLNERFGPFTRDGPIQLVIMSDNPTFDIGSIDVALALDPNKRFPFPLRYTRNGDVRLRVCESNSLLRVLDNVTAKNIKIQAQKDLIHDHWAENDAIVIYKVKILIDQELAKKMPQQSSNSMRPGDWWCEKCQDFVFASRTECRKCGGKKQ